MKEANDYLLINLLGTDEQQLRLARVKDGMRAAGIETAIVRSNTNIYYLTGRVFRGYVYISLGLDEPLYFVRQPSTLRAMPGKKIYHVRKPEEISTILANEGLPVGGRVALELDAMPYAEALRIAKAMGMDAPSENISPVLRNARAVKTACELSKLRTSGEKQTLVYERIPHLYQEGMSDIEFQIEIERASRLEGCLGIFRIGGSEMELFMGNVLTGENADTPSPYDFAMGGAGADPSLPVGADGTVIKPGIPVMVDVNGNYTGYMTDMTRCFYTGSLSDRAGKAVRLSIAICDELAAMMKPGAKASDLYEKALALATDAGMAEFFMGHRYHAGFVGHGIGIEVNELPVLAPRSKDILEAGNVIAVEPKFVIPGIGAAGVENTYIVTAEGGQCITNAPLDSVRLD